MIQGRIDENYEARVTLEILAGQGLQHSVEFLVDTGFNGFLALPMSLVKSLDLRLGGVQRGQTADGRLGFFDTVLAEFLWHGQPLQVHAQVLDEPLIGTRLLRGHEVHATWVPGGGFSLEKRSQA